MFITYNSERMVFMDYVKTQIKRAGSNRIKLFAILCIIHIFILAIFISQGSGNYNAIFMLSIFFVFGPITLYLIFFIPALNSFKDYTKSKLYFELGRLGIGTSQDVCAAVNHEIEHTWYKNSSFKLTENWICSEGVFSFQIKHFDLLCWVYIRKDGLSNCLVFRFSDGKELIMGKERAECDKVINQIEKRYPHVMLGFMEALDSVYKKNPAALGIHHKKQNIGQAPAVTDKAAPEKQIETKPESDIDFQADNGDSVKQWAFFCKSCGKPLPDGADFCPECGSKVLIS